MWRQTLLSWAFVGDMNWAESFQHPYAVGLTWEPLWSRIPENDENLNNFGLFWSFLKFMLQETLLSWASVGVIDWNRVLPTPLAFLQRKMRLLVRCFWDLGFSLTSETFVFRILFHFFLLWDSLSSPTWFLLWFSRTYIFLGLHFFSSLRNSSRTCKFPFLDLYFFPNLFLFRTSIVWKKICVRNPKIKIKSEKKHKRKSQKKYKSVDWYFEFFLELSSFSLRAHDSNVVLKWSQ